MTVYLSDGLAGRIRRHAEEGYPFEVCGLLSGKRQPDGTVAVIDVHESRNVTDRDQKTGFEIDPKLRFDLMRTLESLNDGTEIIGHYHSHPDHPAAPSNTDLAMVYETDFVWLICAVTNDGAGALNAFIPREDRSRFDDVTIKNGPTA